MTCAYLVGLFLPLAIIMFSEFISNKKIWLQNSFDLLNCYLMGAVGSQLIVDLCKYTVGRLRPHFFNVCHPIFDDNLCEPPNSTSPAVVYVVNYTCSGNRQVFPV